MNSADKFTVVDVYDLALEIGKEFEKVIDANGAGSVAGLITKVVNALELMESLACRNESENAIVQELQEKIVQLETEKQEKAASKKRFDKELESIEEQWRSETKDLFKLVDKLQEENRRLMRGLTESEKTISEQQRLANGQSTPSTDEHGQPVQSVGELCDASDYKLQICRLRDELKCKSIEMGEKSSEVESLSMQNERIKNVLNECRRRQKLSHGQIITLCEERADFLAQLQDQQHEIKSLRTQLGIAEKENEDLVHRANEDERPRFSTVDLKEMLTDRNELKARVNDLEQELMTCKALQTDSDDDSGPSSAGPSDMVDGSDDLPVQGPLPFEPDDAPWKKSNESGIRKFFRKLFNDSSDCSSFPQKSLSTLSRMALSSGPHSDIPI